MQWEKIRRMAADGGGYLTTRAVEEAGISRVHLKKYVDGGKLIRVCQGRYVLPEGIHDEYALLQSQSRNAVFSYGTALFLWGMSDRAPHVLDITVPQGTNVTRLKRDNPSVSVHYDSREAHEIGIAETLSPQGYPVILYDKERCVCDMIKARKKTDMQLYSQAIKEYFSNRHDARKLLKYGRRFNIEDKLRAYMEVLT